LDRTAKRKNRISDEDVARCECSSRATRTPMSNLLASILDKVAVTVEAHGARHGGQPAPIQRRRSLPCFTEFVWL
jgi:hypothetical protein